MGKDKCFNCFVSKAKYWCQLVILREMLDYQWGNVDLCWHMHVTRWKARFTRTTLNQAVIQQPKKQWILFTLWWHFAVTCYLMQALIILHSKLRDQKRESGWICMTDSELWRPVITGIMANNVDWMTVSCCDSYVDSIHLSPAQVHVFHISLCQTLVPTLPPWAQNRGVEVTGSPSCFNSSLNLGDCGLFLLLADLE
jgi:hypothetical protein